MSLQLLALYRHLQAGYPLEEHVVTTEDGCILHMQRIPRKGGRHSLLPSPIPSLVWCCTAAATPPLSVLRVTTLPTVRWCLQAHATLCSSSTACWTPRWAGCPTASR